MRDKNGYRDWKSQYRKTFRYCDSNYESWKIQMRSVLICNELRSYAKGDTPKPEGDAADWTRKDEKALALILLSMSKTKEVKKCDTSAEAWTKLEEAHESKGPVRKTILYKQLYRMKKESNQTMMQYTAEFLNKTEQLDDAGIRIPPELLSIMLLSSLPREYESFCIAIESRDNLPTVESLKFKLIEQEARRDHKQSNETLKESNDALLVKGKRFVNKNSSAKTKNFNDKTFDKFKGNCYKCGKKGHRANECRSNKQFATGNSVEDAMPAIVLNTEPHELSSWCFDSGATKHMCVDKEKFSELDKNKTCKVYTAAEHFATPVGVGDIITNVKLRNGSTNCVKLCDVMHVPDFRNNLLSVSQITKNGYKVTFHENHAEVERKDGKIVLTAERKNELYLVYDSAQQEALFTTNNSDDSLRRWHERYGHLNVSDLKKLYNNNMVTGINIKEVNQNFNCQVCDIGKMH